MKKIKKEKKSFNRAYLPLIGESFVLVIFIALLVLVLIWKPTVKNNNSSKKDKVLDSYDMDVSNEYSCDNNIAKVIEKDAKAVDVSYDIIDDYFFGYSGETDEDINGNGTIDEVIELFGYAIKVKLNNITDNIYVVITNDLNDDVKTFYKSDLNENGEIIWYESETVYTRKYTVKVYSNKSECKTLFRKFTVELPRYNTLSDNMDCVLTDAKDLDVCQKFVFGNDRDSQQKEYRKKVDEKLKEVKREKEQQTNNETKNKKDEIIKYVKKNIVLVILIIIAIIITILLIVVSIINRRKK